VIDQIASPLDVIIERRARNMAMKIENAEEGNQQ